MKRFWVKQISDTGSRFELGTEESRHIARVLRYRPGQMISLFDSLGNTCLAEILACRSDCVEVKVIECLENIPMNSQTTLGQALLKGKKMDLVVRKCTELGVNRIIPFGSSRSIPVWTEVKAEARVNHWQQVVTAAVKQSGARSVPEVAPVCSFEKLLSQAPEGFLKLVCWEKEVQVSLKNIFSSSVKLDRVFCVVGPEGGFDDGEIDLARQSGFETVGLGKRTLRSETVPVAVMSILGFARGDFD